MGFKPHIPKEVSNTVPLFCGESLLAQWLWRGEPPSTPPLTTTVVTGDGRFSRHYISLHIKRSSVAAAGQRRSRKRTAAPRLSGATAAPPTVTGDPGTAGARKKKKKVPNSTNGNTLSVLQREVKLGVFTQAARAVSEQTGPPSKSFMSKYIHTA